MNLLKGKGWNREEVNTIHSTGDFDLPSAKSLVSSPGDVYKDVPQSSG